jgi:cysteinyl-tRNA synthetase
MATNRITAEERSELIGIIGEFNSVLGIFDLVEEGSLDDEIEALVQEREEARAKRDFARSDELRDLLAEKGIILEDTRDGVRWKRK